LSNMDCPHGRLVNNCPLCEELGPTGDHPKGKLNEDDEGGLLVKISTENGVVRIDFGKSIAWLGLDPDAAIAFGGSIIDQAMGIKFRGAKEMLEAFGATKQ
jgi:hypothetical protein